jgi:hypothetical protein
MLTLSAVPGPGVRLTGLDRPITAYVPKAAQPGDLVLLSTPEEEPGDDVLSWPGEYDREGVALRGIGQLEGQRVSFLVIADGIRCALLSAPLLEWADADLAQLGDVHVLVLPAEEPKRAQMLLEEIDPRVLVLAPGSDGSVDPEVIRVCGATGKEFQTELKLKALPTEGRDVVVLSA